MGPPASPEGEGAAPPTNGTQALDVATGSSAGAVAPIPTASAPSGTTPPATPEVTIQDAPTIQRPGKVKFRVFKRG